VRFVDFARKNGLAKKKKNHEKKTGTKFGCNPRFGTPIKPVRGEDG